MNKVKGPKTEEFTATAAHARGAAATDVRQTKRKTGNTNRAVRLIPLDYDIARIKDRGDQGKGVTRP
jgi:hypothetical protein